MPDIAFLFDMDGVIVDSNPFHKISLIQFVRKYGFDFTEQQLKEKVFGRTNGEWLTNLFGPMPSARLREMAEEKEKLFREMYARDVKPVPGLISFLEKLEQQKFPKAIATSAPSSNVEFTLDGTGTRRFFKTILDDSFIILSKPNPEIYLKAAAALKMPPEKCIVIEDSLSGLEAGRAAGCKIVGITTTHSPEELVHADCVIEDFIDLDPMTLIKNTGILKTA
ncbi:MAG TPA: HAD family phosphatase [Cyclobacteriaceae bacterium]|nr:HAD family phosphatase [Cyclobacteriaceae bacterium]